MIRFGCFFSVIWFVSLFSVMSHAQDSTRRDGFTRFYYPGGNCSSEGMILNGKPEGYWKSYYPDGIIKSEGNRKNFELDSLWKFYNEAGKITLEVNYRAGKKYGEKITHLDKETIRENFRNDVKEGYTHYYYSDGRIKMSVPFVNGLEQGFGKEYGSDGTIITLTEYKRGFIIDRQRINRRDAGGLKQGRWYIFWDNGSVKQEGKYTDDKKNGYFKDFTETGDLIRIVKYLNDVLQPEAEEIRKLEVQNDYYPDGKLRTMAMFRNGVPEGIRRDYSPDGKIEKGCIYSNGVVVAEGIVLEDGNRNGPWKEFYEDGSVKGIGQYENGKQVGEWKFFHRSGKLEQSGRYGKNGKPEGNWKWYYEDGSLLRSENFRNGQRDGDYSEYDERGSVISEGEYLNGLEEGNWFERIGDSYSRGNYRDGMRTGEWITFFIPSGNNARDSVITFRGSFTEDLPDGKQITYWENGKIREEGSFVMGKREGDWMINNSDGTPFMIITYRNGTEVRYDGVKIKPAFEKED